MVKNTKGGSRHKKLARKNVDDETKKHKTRLANRDEPCEVYAVVTKMYGQGNCEVLCSDGITRLCVIRKKFKGRNKRNNMISLHTILLVGIRDWEIVSTDKKQKCDLLEVYDRYMHDDIKRDSHSNWNLLRTVTLTSDTMNNEDDNYDFDFDFDNTNNNSNIEIDNI